MYTMSDGENCVAWRFGRMELAKGLSAAADDPFILLFNSSLRNEE